MPRRIRVFVVAFLAAFLIAGFGGVEAWPLTGWRLFSALRTDRTASWAVTTVDATGAEAPLPFGRLPKAYHWWLHVVNGFPRRTPAERAAACDAWTAAVRRLGDDVAGIRIYRAERFVSHRSGGRGAPPVSRTLVYTCAGGVVREEASRAPG